MEKGNVSVSVQLQLSALGSPNFVVEHDGKLYLAVAVLEYDEAAVQTSEQREGVGQIRQMYDKAVKEKPVKAGVVQVLSPTIGCMNTNIVQSSRTAK